MQLPFLRLLAFTISLLSPCLSWGTSEWNWNSVLAERIFLPSVDNTRFGEHISRNTESMTYRSVMSFAHLHFKLPVESPRLLDEPNCFNTALRFHYQNIASNFTSDHEMVIAVRDKYRRLNASERHAPGDLILLWTHETTTQSIDSQTRAGRSKTLRHAMIYLGGDWVFEKPSLYKADDYVISTLSQSIQFYYFTPRWLSGEAYSVLEASPIAPQQPILSFHRHRLK